MSTAPRRELLIRLALFGAAALACAVMIFLVRSSGPARGGAGWLPWAFLAMGTFSVGAGLFDKEQKLGPENGWRTQAVVMLLGPTGARFAYAIIGGAFSGAGFGLLAMPT